MGALPYFKSIGDGDTFLSKSCGADVTISAFLFCVQISAHCYVKTKSFFRKLYANV